MYTYFYLCQRALHVRVSPPSQPNVDSPPHSPFIKLPLFLLAESMKL